MIKCGLILWLITFTCLSNGQTAFDVNRVGGNNFGSITIYGVDGNRNEIPYNIIRGSAFWSDEWMYADFFDQRNYKMGRHLAKINLATHEVYYQQRENILAADKNLIKKIIFYNQDQTIATIFYTGGPYIFDKRDDGKYAQIYNTGKHQFIKITTQEVATADSLFGTMKRYFFKPVTRYYIYSGTQTGLIKKLNKENVLSYLPGSRNFSAWIEQNNINFKKEEDIARFFDYYNSRQQ